MCWENEEEDVNSYWMNLKEKRGYWKLKKETLDRPLVRTIYRRDYGTVVRQTTE
jgi:hypothetical protein